MEKHEIYIIKYKSLQNNMYGIADSLFIKRNVYSMCLANGLKGIYIVEIRCGNTRGIYFLLIAVLF